MQATQNDPRDMLLKEVDLALVHALQVDSRAPWSLIGDVIGVDAATVARRWTAISRAGWAWFTVWPSPARHSAHSDAALVRIGGNPSAGQVAAWCALPWVLTVERTSAGLCILAAGRGGLAALERQITTAFGGVHTTVEYASAILRDDSTWRIRALSDHQVARLANRVERTAQARPVDEQIVAEVTALLRENARISFVAIGKRLGVSDATARRTVERLIGEGLVRVGCDVAMPAVGLGRGAVIRIGTSPTTEATNRVVNHRSVHRVVSTVGPATATVNVRMTSLTELHQIERSWGEPDVLDRWTVTSVLKRNGHLLGEDGRSTGHVDVDW